VSIITAASITLDELLNLVFEDAGPSDLIRVVAASRRDFGDLSTFFTRRGNAPWHWPPGANAVSADTPRAVVARNQDTEVTWSPLLYQQSPMTTSPARLPIAFCVLPVKVVASPRLQGYGAVEPESERVALARLAAYTPSPNLVLHQGSSIVGFWRLKTALVAPSEPVVENRSGPWGDKPQAQVQRVLWHLAQALGGSRDDLDPRRSTFACPQTPMPGIFPRREVAVMLGPDVGRRFAIDEL